MIPITSKASAVKLIETAVAAGFKREVSVMKLNDRRLAVTVMLSQTCACGALYTWSHLHISFRLRHGKYRSSVAISSHSDYGKTAHKGLWHAHYAVKYMMEQVQRKAARDARV